MDKDPWIRTSKQEKCTRDLLTGYGGMTVCGLIPQLIALSVGWNKDWGKATLYSSMIIANLSPVFFYPLFIIEHLNCYKLNNKRNLCKHRCWIILAHIRFTVIVSTLAYNFGNEEYHKNVTCFTILYTMTFSSITAEWFVVWNNGIWIKRDRMKEQDQGIQTEMLSKGEKTSELVQVDPYELEAASQNPFKCHICLSPYSSLITPRMLVGCGHTVCEGCVGKLPRNEQYTAQVICPFCRKPTRMPCELKRKFFREFESPPDFFFAFFSNVVVTVASVCGLPSELPKNYAAFGGNLQPKTDKY
ncbi:hypothetical protein CAEBREN_25064 [Caenorhabditis brenneri]|uniref:RING-type domain-containing protein n=1 Tax=Caenorhabditis brenneri TaxID=135651 RepID=G0N7Y8_CAEBE|nr:hypothetical protein CAEBREN_25064 [Caenorhabditis brenneri]